MPEDSQSATIESTTGWQQAGHDAGNAVSRAVEATRAHLTDALGRTCEKTTEAVHSAEARIRRAPIKAVAYTVGIALIVGLVTGILFGERNGGAWHRR
jgi:ElaB/YqjD/DUF883 family membrane-anchored ribosome-binding protein